jgi:hypoxanthine phosphoribosyltransferase
VAENNDEVWFITSEQVKTVSFTYDKVFQLVCAKETAMRNEKPGLVVGIARGGIVPASMVAQRLGVPLNIINKSRGNEINWEYGPLPENKVILLVDDIVGSGETIMAVKAFLEKSNNKVVTYTVFYDSHRSKYIPDISEPAPGYIRFPWDMREVSPGSKATYKSMGYLPPDKEVECFGLDFAGIFLGSDIPKVPHELSVIITGKPGKDYEKTREWLNGNGFQDIPLYCRDETVYPESPDGIARFKADKITEIGVSRFFEIELWQAVKIAEICPAIDIIWWDKDKKLRIGGVSEFNWVTGEG